MKKLLIATALIFAAGHAMAAEPANNAALETQPYHYGTQLDIAKVVSVSRSHNDCEVGTQRMVYVDSSGAEHAIRYEVVDDGNGCNS
ncbi:DUF2790 domain-containing protein [Pseudomonas sp. Pseusp122]|uniref:DUF2790 domain-containing protein n=1 Tax=unclassified Pseudomonas TaxID=196821 RepID=UPI0039A4521E